MTALRPCTSFPDCQESVLVQPNVLHFLQGAEMGHVGSDDVPQLGFIHRLELNTVRFHFEVSLGAMLGSTLSHSSRVQDGGFLSLSNFLTATIRIPAQVRIVTVRKLLREGKPPSWNSGRVG